MKEFSYTVQSIDKATGTMVVEYEHNGRKSALNIPIPAADADVASQIALYAPVAEWNRQDHELANFEVGHTGTGLFAEGELPTGEVPNTMGNWNEEYLRAMIYQVLEEVRESEV